MVSLSKYSSTSFVFIKKSLIILVLILLITLALFLFSHRMNSSLENDTGLRNVPESLWEPPIRLTSSRHYTNLVSPIITNWARELDVQSSVYFELLSPGGPTVSTHRSDIPRVPASTYKLFLVYAYLHQVEVGSVSLSQLVYDNMSADECIQSMLLVSSDVCSFALGNTMGWNNVDSFLNSKGFTSTVLNNYDSVGNFTKNKQSTAQDLGLLLKRLALGELLSQESSTYMLDAMARQQWRERIPSGVPSSVRVAGKPGWLDDIENDAAIVYSDKGTYILVIFTDKAPIGSLSGLSKQIYDQVII